MPRYDHKRIEEKWQKFWDEQGTFRTPDDIAAPEVAGKEKLYVLDMFPYPSGNGLHVGHPEGYTATDIVCRYSRMRGKNVLHPMGWDAFGLPAEQHAVKTGTHPRITTEKNIDTFRRQLKMLGFSYDWDREFSTTDPGYFRWTQWIFLQIFDTWYDPEFEWTDAAGKNHVGKGRPIAELPVPDEVTAQGEEAVRRYQDKHRLAYQHEAPVNWCSELRTVLSNEEVNAEGLSEREGHPVTRIPLRQWMLRITAYADRLLDDLEELDWTDSVKALQRNWIGKSTGAEVDFFVGMPDVPDLQVAFAEWQAVRKGTGFPAEPGDDVLRIYTTRPDTLFGATYMVLAPEHPFVEELTTEENRDAVEAYRRQASLKSDLDRTDLAKEKTGVFTGAYAINPTNGEQVPIWIADYVLISYGTGAIMAVPAHDLRDWEFAVTFGLPIVPVVRPPEGYEPAKEELALAQNSGASMKAPFVGTGTAMNSGDFNGLETAEFKTRITAQMAETGFGKKASNFRLRDWLFSRQHFWGEPFPIWHELDADGNMTGLMRTDGDESLPIELPQNFEFKPHGRPEPPLDESPEEWLYRTDEDGKKLKRETNSMPQWAGSCWYYLRFCDSKNDKQFIDPEKEKYWMPVDLYIGGAEHAVLHLLYSRFWHKVTKKGDQFVLKEDPSIVVDSRAYKMSKSRGNVINPDDVVQQYGADALRMYEMFMGPLEQMKPWNMSGVEGISRFIGRVWRMLIDDRADELQLAAAVQDAEPTDDQLRVLHKTIKAVTEDIEKLSFNTAISRMMEFTNAMTQCDVRPRAVIDPFVLLLSPFAPHVAEELWQILGHENTLAYEPWPEFDESKIVESTIEIPVQVNGKLRAKLQLPADADKAAMQSAAETDDEVLKFIDGKTVVKVIVVPGRMVNFVVK
eukprot:g26720.t1